jgi:hypothetical protein
VRKPTPVSKQWKASLAVLRLVTRSWIAFSILRPLSFYWRPVAILPLSAAELKPSGRIELAASAVISSSVLTSS